jgi:hypothetical protein
MTLPCWQSATLSLTLVSCFPATVIAQGDVGEAGHRLEDLTLLEGSWEGRIDGTLGPATGQRRYRFILNDRFLLMLHDRNPEERASQGDAHEEWSIFSFDTDRGVFVVREFLLEGLVNTYACDFAVEPKSLSCQSEATEGVHGLSLSLRYEFGDSDHFTETFEISGPDGVREVRMEGRWQRTREQEAGAAP